MLNWILTILHLTKHYIYSIVKNRLFLYSRGIQQGGPLSPLLFYLTKEVFNLGLGKLMEFNQLKYIKGTVFIHVPSHILYEDYVMLFSKWTTTNIYVLIDFFSIYVQTSGQKSIIFIGYMTQLRLFHIEISLCFNIGTLPFIYVGVPIFKGNSKACCFYPIIYKIISKLPSWKGSLLSFVDIVCLFISVLYKMLIYYFTICSWSISLIKDLKRYTRNFTWTGDLNSRKVAINIWNTFFSHTRDGGLDIISLSKINGASNLKLCW